MIAFNPIQELIEKAVHAIKGMDRFFMYFAHELLC